MARSPTWPSSARPTTMLPSSLEALELPRTCACQSSGLSPAAPGVWVGRVGHLAAVGDLCFLTHIAALGWNCCRMGLRSHFSKMCGFSAFCLVRSHPLRWSRRRSAHIHTVSHTLLAAQGPAFLLGCWVRVLQDMGPFFLCLWVLLW